MTKLLTRLLCGLALAAVVGAGSVTLANADEGTPNDVQAAYSEEALAGLRSMEESSVSIDETDGPDFSAATSFGFPRRVHLWSDDLVQGEETAVPTTTVDEWLAPVLGPEDEPLGTFRVWRPTSEKQAELAGYNDDAELAGALQKLEDDSALISDPTIEAWYALDGGIVTALNQSAAREVPIPAAIDEVAGTVAARYAEAIESSEEIGEGAAGGMPVDDQRPWYDGMNLGILIPAIMLILAAGLGLAWQTLNARKRRRSG